MGAEELGSRLRAARETRGLNQQTVARTLGLPRTAMTQLEAGDRPVSSLELTRLSELYLHPVADLLHEGSVNEDKEVLVALHHAAPEPEEDVDTREQAARCVHLCREGVALERLLGNEHRPDLPGYEMRLPRSSGEAVAQGEATAEQERFGRNYVKILSMFDNVDEREKLHHWNLELCMKIAHLAIEAYRREEISRGRVLELSKTLRIAGDTLLALAESARDA